MIDHISFGVTNVARSLAFYDAVLAPLGFARIWTTKDAAGYGFPDQDEEFAIRGEDEPVFGSTRQSHLAFAAPDRESVTAFYIAAIGQGAENEGEPGLCPEYGDNYFAAFVRDLDGYRIEVVYHG